MKIGLRFRDLSGNLLEMVDANYSGSVPVYELKYVHADNTLSKGSIIVFGSQLELYKMEA